MSNKSRDYDLELFNVMNALGDVEWEMSEDELVAELRAEGEDIETEGEHVREAFRTAIKEYRKAPLRAAQKKYEQHLAEILKKNFHLPDSAAERRNLLSRYLASKPEFSSSLLTAQHREFKDLTDTDVESYLKQLMELGALDSFSEGEEQAT